MPPWRPPPPATHPVGQHEHWAPGTLVGCGCSRGSMCGCGPDHAGHPQGGFGAERPPSLGASSTQWACPAVPGLSDRGGLRPCWRLARINKQIPWICGFFGPAAPAGRRPAAVPKAAPQGAAGRRSVTNHGMGTRVISIAVQTSPRQSETSPPELPPAPLLPAASPNPARPPQGSRDAPASITTAPTPEHPVG